MNDSFGIRNRDITAPCNWGSQPAQRELVLFPYTGTARHVERMNGTLVVRHVQETGVDIQSGRSTRGHRFMSRGDIDIASADAYEPTLLAEGKVIPDFAERRANIEKQLLAEAGRQNAKLDDYADLLPLGA